MVLDYNLLLVCMLKSIPIYTLQVIKSLGKIFHRIDKSFNRFLWEDTSEKKNIHWST